MKCGHQPQVPATCRSIACVASPKDDNHAQLHHDLNDNKPAYDIEGLKAACDSAG